MPVLYFFRRRVFSEAQARADAQTAVRGFQLVPLTTAILDTATASSLPDFEDNIQLASAQTIQAAYLITRNTKDFQPVPLPVVTPEA
ncbi:MAG: PIN domain-containing protein [Deltaproteobacteria bacterium]|nr:PIN domain-containing protein [Deltaproteobacteria bacterium]